MFLKRIIIFLILISDLESAVRWTWQEVRGNYLLVHGKAGSARAVSGRAAAVHRCSAFCKDASGCWTSGCHYDLGTLHCYESGASDRVQYHGYSPLSRSETTCINIGGGAVTGEFGYQFDADPQTSFLLAYYRLSTSAGIAGAGRDQPVYQTARTASRYPIQYYLKFTGDGYFLCRFMYAEIGGKRRNFNVVLNNAFVLKSNFDVAGTMGYNSAYAHYITVKVQNGINQIVYNGQARGLQGGGLALLNIQKNGWLGTGILNGFCSTKFPPCTEFCNDPDGCNSRSECYYDYKISHCVQASFRPPPPIAPPTPRPCASFGSDRDACEARGCHFCCETFTCSTEANADCVDSNCGRYCFQETECLANDIPNNCSYDSIGKCHDCPAKLQVAFVINAGIVGNLTSDHFFRDFVNQHIDDIKELFGDPEFAVTSFADWDKSVLKQGTHDDIEGCYKIVQNFTMDTSKIKDAKIVYLPSTYPGPKNALTSLVWTTTDERIGWNWEDFVKTKNCAKRTVVRMMTLIDYTGYHETNAEDAVWGNRTETIINGTNFCQSNRQPPSYNWVIDLLLQLRMGPAVIYFPNDDGHESWHSIYKWAPLFNEAPVYNAFLGVVRNLEYSKF